MIYLDNASTTRVFDEASVRMREVESEFFFNPSSLYSKSMAVKDLMDDARKALAKSMGAASPTEVFFTSCATESNNWVMGCGFKNKKGNIVISAGEHASVFAAANALKNKGADVRLVGLNADGSLNLDDLCRCLDEQTSLVSLIHCSNETGVITPLDKIAKLVRARAPNALFHSDGVQALCKIPVDVRAFDVDFYTVSAHKLGGPKGVGALYINKRNRISPLIFGGGQESGLRSGTENTAGIVGFGAAISMHEALQTQQILQERNQIYSLFKNSLTADGWRFNGSTSDFSNYILSLSFDGIRAEVFQHMLEDEGVLIGLGSSCSSKSGDNRTLSAMGLTKRQIEGSIRLSFSPHLTYPQAEIALEKIRQTLTKIKTNLNIN